MTSKLIRTLAVTGIMSLALIILSCAPAPTATPAPVATTPTTGTPNPSQTDWDNTLAAARKEGTLVIYSPATAEVQRSISQSMKDKYGVTVEWTSLKTQEIPVKLSQERRAGLYLADAVAGGGVSQMMNDLKPTGALDPIKPLLVLPEVLDTKLWYGGQLPWVDNEKMYVVCPILGPDYKLYINTNLVKPDEIKAYSDLLDPRWKGKVMMSNPVLYPAAFAEVRELMGTDFLRKLAQTEPVIVDDEGLGANWLGQGKYPIIIINRVDVITQMITAGAPVKKVAPKEGAFLAGGSMYTSVVNRAPHPNAAKVLSNWWLSKDGATMFSKLVGMQSARLDIPTDFLSPDAIRDSSVKYLIAETEEFRGPASAAGRALGAELFGPGGHG